MNHRLMLTALAAAMALAGCRNEKHDAAPAPVVEQHAADGSGHATAAAPPATAEPDPTHTARQTLEGGLTIEDRKIGAGPACPPGATVRVNFTAAFASGPQAGHVYDSTESRKRSLELPLGSPSLIQGLRVGVPGMRVGGVRVVHIPASLAYGKAGRDPIPPNTDLEFELELLDIIAPAPPQR